MSQDIKRSPFKFLDAFNKEDQSIFFGRDVEVNEVFDKSFQSRLLLVYGASGTGKSSIIHCGLANKFSESDWMPVSIRRGGHIMRSWYQQVNKWTFAQEPAPEAIDADVLKAVTTSAYMDQFKPVYFIFDQFEELFIFGEDDEINAFVEAVRAFLDSDLDVHFIFILRGEYLEFLTDFEDRIPHFFDNRVRIEKMTRRRAEDCITGPCDAFGIETESGFERELLSKINPDKGYVELTFLQVYLDRIYQEALQGSNHSGALKFTTDQLERMGEIGDVLAEFVDEQIFKMKDSKAALAVLKALVSVEGTKVQRTIGEIHAVCAEWGFTFNIDETEQMVLSFVDKRILTDRDDEGRFEFRHDSLAQKIFERITVQERELLEARNFIQLNYREFEKRGKLLTEEDLQYIALYERNLNLSDEQVAFIRESERKSLSHRRKQRRRSVISAVIVVLLIVSVVGFFRARQQEKRANELAQLSMQNSERAEEEKARAESERERAETERIRAEENENVALESARDAENARREAIRQEQLANASARRAIEEKESADVARSQAVLSAQEAEDQRNIAESAEARTEQLLMLSLARELALKSLRVPESETALQLALIAANVHLENSGDRWSPELYQAFLRIDESQAYAGLITTEMSVVSRSVEETSGLDLAEGFTWSGGRLSYNGKDEWAIEYSSSLTAFEMNSAKSTIALGFSDGIVMLVDARSGEISTRLGGHRAAITDLAFSPIGSSLLSSSYDRSARMWLLDQEGLMPMEVYDPSKWIAEVHWENEAVWSYTDFDGKKVLLPTDWQAWFDHYCTLNIDPLSKANWSKYVSKELNFELPCHEK